MTSSDDHYTLFVNGREIGSGHCRNDNTPGRASFVFTVGLDPESRNVVAIAGENSAASAGLIATIHVDYSDGTSKTIVTDTNWKTIQATPPGGWTSPSYNDTVWTAAVSEGPTASTPWKSPPLPPVLNMNGVHWIQTNEGFSSGSSNPLLQRPFRKTITSPYGKSCCLRPGCSLCVRLLMFSVINISFCFLGRTCILSTLTARIFAVDQTTRKCKPIRSPTWIRT